jgi:hypothetical protein
VYKPKKILPDRQHAPVGHAGASNRVRFSRFGQDLLLHFGVSATRVGCIDRKQFANEDWTFADIILTARRT